MLERVRDRLLLEPRWRDPKATPYEILGIKPGASEGDPSRLSLLGFALPPDCYSDVPQLRVQAEFVMKRVNAAYQALSQRPNARAGVTRRSRTRQFDVEAQPPCLDVWAPRYLSTGSREGCGTHHGGGEQRPGGVSHGECAYVPGRVGVPGWRLPQPRQARMAPCAPLTLVAGRPPQREYTRTPDPPVPPRTSAPAIWPGHFALASAVHRCSALTMGCLPALHISPQSALLPSRSGRFCVQEPRTARWWPPQPRTARMALLGGKPPIPFEVIAVICARGPRCHDHRSP